jgi:translocation and assembly module TamB
MSYKRIIKRVGRSVLYLFISVAILVCLFLLFINLPVGRRVVKNQVQSYLEGKFKSKVVIGSIDYSLPKWIEVNDVYIEDKNRDTLLYGEKIYVDVDMYRLAFGYTNIREVAFNNIVIHVNRRENDTSFNYQFVMDAFAGNKPASQVDKDTVEMKLTLSRLLFNKVLLKYRDKKEGIDFDAYIRDLDASLSSFRPERTIFAIQYFRATDVDFDMTMYKENKRDTLVLEPGTLDSLPGNGLHITAKRLNLRNVHVSVQDKITGMYYTNKVRHLGLTNALFDLPRSIGTADSLMLDSSFVQFTNPVARPKQGVVDTNLVSNAPWYINVKQVSLSDNQLKFDDNNMARAGGFDPSHFNVKGLKTDIADLLFSKDRTQANVKQFAFRDTSGFQLDDGFDHRCNRPLCENTGFVAT